MPSEWSRGALLLLGGYALFQVFLWAFVLPSNGPAPSPLSPTLAPGAPVRGAPDSLCAASSFSPEGTGARIALFDPTVLTVGSGPAAHTPHNGEEVWRQLSLLRESVRDGWIHMAGDVALKQTFYDLVSLLGRQGVEPSLAPREVAKRIAQRGAAKTEVRVGSTKVSFAYRPLLSDLSKDWNSGAVWKGVAPPSVVVYSAGTWDVANGTERVVQQADAFVAALRNQIAAKIAQGKRVPTVVFLSAPAFAEATRASTGLSAHTQALVAAEEALMAHLKQSIADAQAHLALIKSPVPAASQQSQQPVPQRILFIDVKPLSSPLIGSAARGRGGGPAFEDDGVHVLLNPAGTAASLAAFVSCHLGQPVWALHAFTAGQVTLALLWLAVVGWWVLLQVHKWIPFSFSLSASSSSSPSFSHRVSGVQYHRVGASDPAEIELGPVGVGAAGGGGGVGSTSIGGSTSTSTSATTAAALNLSPLQSLLAYFSSAAWANVLSCLVQLGCVLLFMFLCDSNHRVSWWLVGDKLYVRDTFLFVLAVLFLLAWRSVGSTTDHTDALLNREQTEEWKGVMQLLFVLYHYFAAKEMYNLIRVFIGAYVWMTGYGNFFFFYKTNDYSPARLFKMLFRLNFFVALVCVALNREFMQYYVCALHTFYFLCVYVMMGVCWQWNKSDRLLALKFVILFGVLFVLFDVPSWGVFHTLFAPFSLFYWNNSLHEWWFRSSLDHYATALGMLCAWNVRRLEDFLGRIGGEGSHAHSLTGGTGNNTRKWVVQGGVALVCFILGVLWMVYCLWLPKAAYNAQHPYTSIIPIALYILLRNLTPFLRRHVLFLFTWFGKITLETYILQFHIWLSDDAATILTYFPDYPLFNWILSSAIYIALSLLMFQITNIVSDALIPRVCSTKELLFKTFVLVSGWYTLYNVVNAAMAATI